MRDLTEDEIAEYFEFADKDVHPADFNYQQATLIGNAVVESRFFQAIAPRVVLALQNGYTSKDLVLSLWVTAFLMGRECESRLLTLALKGKNR